MPYSEFKNRMNTSQPIYYAIYGASATNWGTINQYANADLDKSLLPEIHYPNLSESKIEGVYEW
jgi:hypothetical protein